MRGSWPVLLGLGALFVGGLLALRSTSTVLAAERDAPAARALAERLGLPPASVLALRARSRERDDQAFAALVERFAQLARELGEPLAAVAVFGAEAKARAVLAAGGGDPAAAWQRGRFLPELCDGVEFLQLQQRFAARDSGRQR